MLVILSCCFVAARLLLSHVLRYAPSSLTRAPRIRTNWLRIFSTMLKNLVKMFLVFSVQFNNCIYPQSVLKRLRRFNLDFVFVVNLLLHNLILYSVFKVHSILHFSQKNRLLGRLPCVFMLVVENKGLEPLTPCVQGRCSPSWANSPHACYFVLLLCCCSFSPQSRTHVRSFVVRLRASHQNKLTAHSFTLFPYIEKVHSAEI